MTRKNLIETAEALLAGDLLERQDGTLTRGGRTISRHLTSVRNKTGDRAHHMRILARSCANTMKFHEITVA